MVYRRIDQSGAVTRQAARALGLAVLILILISAAPAAAQFPGQRSGDAVTRDVREMYDHGLQYLAAQQTTHGDWPATGPDNGPATTGLCLMAFLASGEDPNFGLYSNHVRKAVRNLIQTQDPTTGILGSSMYHHGFATLALAEAYGAVDERALWPDGKAPRSLGQALELAVRGAVTAQKHNQAGGWRYSPSSRDADTSVSGAVLVGLLAARNAGIEVPDESINKAIAYYTQMTASAGSVAYSGMGGFDNSVARMSIGTLVYALARRKDLPQYKAAIKNLAQRIEQPAQPYPEYTRYYEAQALFQGDPGAWEKWNTLLVRQLKQTQRSDGSFPGQFGAAFSTAMSLLALALNYRFLPIYER